MSFNTQTKLDLITAETPGELLSNVKSHLEKEKLKPVSMNVVKEHNSFCALVVSEPKFNSEYIG